MKLNLKKLFINKITILFTKIVALKNKVSNKLLEKAKIIKSKLNKLKK